MLWCPSSHKKCIYLFPLDAISVKSTYCSSRVNTYRTGAVEELARYKRTCRSLYDVRWGAGKGNNDERSTSRMQVRFFLKRKMFDTSATKQTTRGRRLRIQILICVSMTMGFLRRLQKSRQYLADEEKLEGCAAACESFAFQVVKIGIIEAYACDRCSYEAYWFLRERHQPLRPLLCENFEITCRTVAHIY